MEKVPESIPYLINRGRIEEAHALVQKLEAEACVQIVHHIEVVPVAMRQKFHLNSSGVVNLLVEV